MRDKNNLLNEYTNILTSKFKNSNRYIVEIKSAQASLKRFELERAGATVIELRKAISSARKDAVCFLLMELAEFLGDQQMIKSSKSTKSFMQWGIKQIIVKLRELGVEITEAEINELTIEACMERVNKLKTNRSELESKLELIRYYQGVLAV